MPPAHLGEGHLVNAALVYDIHSASKTAGIQGLTLDRILDFQRMEGHWQAFPIGWICKVRATMQLFAAFDATCPRFSPP